MNVNDLLVCGAQPIVFLDYIACGRIDETRMQDLMRGIVRGLRARGVQPRRRRDGGDARPVRPGRFRPCGVRRRHRGEATPCFRAGMRSGRGDLILGLPSSGIHSNGLSLARKVIPESDRAGWEDLLTPTIIYAREMEVLTKSGKVLAAAHITGGGLSGNLQRVIPDGLSPPLHLRLGRATGLRQDPRRGGTRRRDAPRVQPRHRHCAGCAWQRTGTSSLPLRRRKASGCMVIGVLA